MTSALPGLGRSKGRVLRTSPGTWSNPGPILPSPVVPHPLQPWPDQNPSNPPLPPLSTPLGSSPHTRPIRMVRRKRLSPAMRMFTALVLTLSGSAIIYAGGTFLSQLAVFRVQPSTIQFESTLPEAMVAEARLRVLAALPPSLSLLETRTQRIEGALKADPRMADIRVQLRPPNRILISAMERVPEALIAVGKSALFVDGDGTVLREATPQQIAETDRPFITGLDPQSVLPGHLVESSMAALGLQLLRVLRTEHPEFHARMSELHIGRDTVSHLESLTIHLEVGTEIRLGSRDPVTRVPDMLAVVAKLEKDGQNLADLAYIDLTGKERVAIMDRITALAAATGLDVEAISGMAQANRLASQLPVSRGPAAPTTPGTGSPIPARSNTSDAPARSAYDLPSATSQSTVPNRTPTGGRN